MQPYIPDYCIGTNGSWYVSGSIASFNLEPRVYADFDFWQLEIVSIEYYIDDELVKTDKQEPYSFVYTAVGLDWIFWVSVPRMWTVWSAILMN